MISFLQTFMTNAVIQNVNNGFITMIKVPNCFVTLRAQTFYKIFHLAVPNLYKEFFLPILMVQHLYFLFQLVCSLKNCPSGLETACLIAPCGAEFEVLKFLSQDVLQNIMQKHHIPNLLLNMGHCNTQSNVSSIKKKY